LTIASSDPDRWPTAHLLSMGQLFRSFVLPNAAGDWGKIWAKACESPSVRSLKLFLGANESITNSKPILQEINQIRYVYTAFWRCDGGAQIVSCKAVPTSGFPPTKQAGTCLLHQQLLTTNCQ